MALGENVQLDMPPAKATTTISIALATYNGAAFLPAQLASLACQTRIPDELVIADDCSGDGTAAVVDDFATTAPFRVRLMPGASNVGLLGNFERAIAGCTGDIILLCDQDDVWLPDKIELFERAFAKHERLAAVFSDAYIVDRDLRKIGMTVWEKENFTPSERETVRAGRFEEVLIRHNVVQGASLGFRRSLVPYALPLPPLNTDIWVHDGWIALCAALTGGIGLLERPLILYRIHGKNVVGNANRPVIIDKGPSWFINKLRRTLLGGERPKSAGADAFTSVRSFDAHWRSVLVTLKQRVPPSRRSERLHRRVNQKLLHSAARGELATSRNAVLVARELVTGRYHRWSEGFISAARDMLQR